MDFKNYIYIYGGTGTNVDRDELEDDIEEALGELGEVTGSGSGINGWNLDTEFQGAENKRKALKAILKVLDQHKLLDKCEVDLCGKISKANELPK